MFKGKTTGPSTSRSFDSLIGENSVFEGNVNCEGAIRIDGKVKGDIKAAEDIVIGETAQVNGNIYGNNIQISGTVDGNIYSKYMVRLCSSARLHGDVEAMSFVTEEGAFFNGKCNMISPSGNQKD
ncbi:MAG: polymer-forming cytoskeletal protein [Firmicutes bacterium]|nr:polymer-forming cytoskeletal protein [Bacillota bacterium]